MTSKLIDAVARQLRLPEKGVLGWMVCNMFKYQNAVLERNAARLCAIEPHHKVLEIGFGPGIGVQHALQYLKDGPGKVCGVDLSPYMVEKASARLRRAIEQGRVELGLGSVTDLPYSADTFHSVFHTNCYYFWPSMQDALRELHRVMRPGAVMVALLDLKLVQRAKAKGLFKYGNTDPLWYMSALELTGFSDVRIEYFTEGSVSYQAIFAHLHTKEQEAVDLWDEEPFSHVEDSDRRQDVQNPSSHDSSSSSTSTSHNRGQA